MKQWAVLLHLDVAVSATWEGTPVRHSEKGVPTSGQWRLLATVGRL
jgi:hypothetical protein